MLFQQSSDGNNPCVKTILILAANPKSTSRLRLDEEVREIDEGLRRASKREQFRLEQKWAVRQRDFYRAILDCQPQIVHFSGHGTGEEGIVLEDETDQPVAVNALALASMFKVFAKYGVQCVLLIACYSEVQAKSISQHVNYVIGMNTTVGDKVAKDFSVAFYDALAAGQDIEDAYELACAILINYSEQQTPVLFKKDQISITQPEVEIIPPNPYQGLAAFSEEDAAFFFGREKFVNDLVEAVNKQPLVAVIGSSGSGKSSVVYAGLIPHLRMTENWLIESFRPGKQPFYQLASALVRQLEPEVDQIQQLRSAAGLDKDIQQGLVTLQQITSRIIERNPDKRLLLFVDQFEELYTVRQKEEQERFADLMLEAIDQKILTLVFTLRADFYGFVLAYRPFRDALQQFPPQLLSAMNPEELLRPIEQPAQKIEVQLEAHLAERILDDVGNEPGNLPLLEFALTRLWNKQQKRRLTHQAYDEIGGVKKALANHAEQIYQQLNEQEQKQAQRIFVQLVRPGEGTEDTRRIATRAEVGDENWELVSYLAGYKARLVVTGSDEKSGGDTVDTVEVVHEALIREWLTLREWMKKDRLFRAWQERLRVVIHQWEETNRDEGVLLRGVPLGEAEEKLKERREELSPPEQNFIQQSIELRDRLLQQEEERRQQELETARKIAQESEARRKAAQRTTRVTFGASVIVLVFAIFAGYQWRQAEIQQIQTLLQSSEANLNSSHGLEARIASLTAGKILKHSWWQAILPEIGLENQVLGELSQTIYDAGWELNRLEDHQNRVNSVVFSPNGKLLATGGSDGTARLWDISGQPLALLNGDQRSVNSVVFSPDGKLLATGGSDGTVRLWDTSGQHKQLVVFKVYQDSLDSVVFSPDGKLLATAGIGATARLWDTSGQQLAVLKGDQRSVNRVVFNRVVFSPDSKLLATSGTDGTARLWDTSGQHKQLAVLKGHQGLVNSVVFSPSPDGKLLATSGTDGTARLWNTSGQQLAVLKGDQRSVVSVVVSPDGKLLATAGADGTARLWDTSGQHKQLAVLKGHQDSVVSVVFSPDGKLLATAGTDGTARLWDTSGQHKQLAILKGDHPSLIGVSVVFSPDGKLLATAGADGTARLWDTSRQQLALPHGLVLGVIFSPDGKLLATGGTDGNARLWDTSGQHKQLALLKGHQGTVGSVVFSPDGKLLATGGSDGTGRVWDTSGQHKQLALLKGHQFWPVSVVFSPDGRLLATAGTDGTARLWDTSGQHKQLAVLKGHQGSVHSVVFSPDGKLLATGGTDGTARLWDISGQHKQLAVLNGDQRSVSRVVFSLDGKLLATAGGDHTVRLWDTSGQHKQLAVLKGHQDSVVSVVFSRNGRLLATAGSDGTARLWDTSGKLLAVLKGHQGAVNSVVFSRNGRLLATAGSDGTARLWNTSGKLLAVLKGHQGQVTSVVFSPDGKLLATAGGEATARLWPVEGLDRVLAVSCGWVRDYLRTNPNVSDRTLCDDVGTRK
ncbi:eIF2A-related protein [Aetokthonos hydrillicola]|uniref:nSTAND1 domain-containing NTPase n=1 Tax=Aetokthonos hydrillicola TaxID=1550245 RepID=UPI001B17D769